MSSRTDVVTVFLTHRGKILVAKRSREVRTYPGHWAGISGYLETDDPLEQAYIEVREETGLEEKDVKKVVKGPPLEVDDPEADLYWRVHPFRFDLLKETLIELDREHVRYRWIDPPDLSTLQTVPALKQAWAEVSHDC